MLSVTEIYVIRFMIQVIPTKLHGFLGLTRYYRKFIKNYELLTKLLTALWSKIGFNWTKQATPTFDTLKHAMTKTPPYQISLNY